MWMSRAAAVLLAGLAVAATAALPLMARPAPAVAAAPRADLAIATSPVAGKVGQAVDVKYVIRNNGPNAVLPLSWVVDVVAPAGTQIVNAGTAACEVVTAGRHLRCRYGFGLASGDRKSLTVRVRVENVPTGCGRLALTYSDDPRPGNNTANIRITVDGLPASCAVASRSPSPSPKPSRTRASASPSPTSSEPAEPTEDETSAEETYAPLTPSGGEDGGGLGLGSILVIGGGAVLVALGGLLVWRLLRTDPDDDYEDDDATGPIRF
ncbi:MAG: hypothetical protein HOV79_04180 [Hamadaea sp.]|nr:hypothetical protein [Hamadaea sp.]